MVGKYGNLSIYIALSLAPSQPPRILSAYLKYHLTQTFILSYLNLAIVVVSTVDRDVVD